LKQKSTIWIFSLNKKSLRKNYKDNFENTLTFALMDLKIDKLTHQDTLIYTLSFSDFDPMQYIDHLTSIELERFERFGHIKRKREFVATRILRHSIFGHKHIHYNFVGAPFIEDEGFISISHADKLVGIALNPHYQIGLDLEMIEVKAQKLHSKFLNEKELDFFDSTSKEIMTACWSSKETLYKLAGRKQIDFKKDLHLYIIEENLWKGEIINPQEIFSVNLQIIQYNNYIITFNSSPIEIAKR
jgi:phosphopantetheinyl transferase